MIKNYLAAVIVLIFVIPNPNLFGQELPSGKWWRFPRVVERLNLSDSEIEQLDNAFQDSRRNLITLKSNLEREQFELETLVENRTLDEKALISQYERLENARVALGTERFKFFIKIRRIVGYERFQQLIAFKKMADQRKKEGLKSKP